MRAYQLDDFILYFNKKDPAFYNEVHSCLIFNDQENRMELIKSPILTPKQTERIRLMLEDFENTIK